MNATITISGYAPDRFARLEASLGEKGLKMAGSDGEVKDFGADVRFHYDAAAGILTLTVLHGPHFHDFQTFCDQLKSRVEAQT